MYHVPAFPVINQRNKTKGVCFPAMESNESEKTEENFFSKDKIRADSRLNEKECFQCQSYAS